MSKSDKDTIKLSLVLPKELNSQIEAAAENLGYTKTAYLRKSIDLMQVASELKSQGKQLAAIDHKKHVDGIIYGL